MDLCRITVAGPERRIDLSLPSDVPFGSLLPVLLRHSGADLANEGLAHGGWVLQRLDEAPFDLGASPGQAGVRDGEVLYLRPRTAQLPELAFDDVPDVIATAVRERPDRWSPALTRRAGLGVGVLACAVTVLLLVLRGGG
ncbi:EsaB/YukD family protein, partial [Actinocorallia lasiicapitis]